jgi:hypothetical protein
LGYVKEIAFQDVSTPAAFKLPLKVSNIKSHKILAN